MTALALMKTIPKVIPPRSRVRLVSADKLTRAWRKDVGRPTSEQSAADVPCDDIESCARMVKKLIPVTALSNYSLPGRLGTVQAFSIQ